MPQRGIEVVAHPVFGLTRVSRDDRLCDAGEASNMAKFLAAEAATGCVDQAIEVHGGSGFAREVALANMYEFVRLFKTVPITRAMILNHIAQHSLGLPKSY